MFCSSSLRYGHYREGNCRAHVQYPTPFTTTAGHFASMVSEPICTVPNCDNFFEQALKEHGIRVMTIFPSVVDTALAR